jgi:hypothetical protein
MLRRSVVLLGLLASIGCGGKADLGEECDTAGSTDDCVNGAVCTNDTGGQRCRRICIDDTQCTSVEACNGVSGTNIKSCQPKK